MEAGGWRRRSRQSAGYEKGGVRAHAGGFIQPPCYLLLHTYPSSSMRGSTLRPSCFWLFVQPMHSLHVWGFGSAVPRILNLQHNTIANDTS